MESSLPVPIYPPDLVQPFIEHLAEDLKALGALSSPALLRAFLAVPRHLFLPSYYERQGSHLSWQCHRAPASESEPEVIRAWLAQVYTNRPRTTLLDEYQLPVSSSSQPSLMAVMLNALHVEPGMKVLEVGTGTGYNAALLAHLVGAQGHVITLERNPILARQARLALDHIVAGNIETHVGDGVQGWNVQAPFDRIIITARSSTLYDGWLDQLAPGGRFVVDLGGELAGALLVAEKSADGLHVEGSFLPTRINFMLLQSSAAPSPALKPLFHTLAQKSPLQVPIQQDDGEPFSPEIFREHAFRFFLQWRFPRAALEWWGDHPDRLQPAFLEPLSQTLLTFFDQSQLSPRAWLVQIHGSSLLWEQFWQAYRDWRAWKCPAPQRYRLQIEKTCTSYQKRLIIWPEERQSPVSHALHFPLA